jgi:hypothetical protein
MTTSSTQDRSLDSAHRLALRAVVRNAADTVAPVWPLKTFIACNPLQGFEGLPFEQAVAEGSTLFGGRGYLPNAEYRRQWRDGRIADAALRDALIRLGPAARASEAAYAEVNEVAGGSSRARRMRARSATTSRWRTSSAP